MNGKRSCQLRTEASPTPPPQKKLPDSLHQGNVEMRLQLTAVVRAGLGGFPVWQLNLLFVVSNVL